MGLDRAQGGCWSGPCWRAPPRARLAYAGYIAAGEPAELTDAVELWVYHASPRLREPHLLRARRAGARPESRLGGVRPWAAVAGPPATSTGRSRSPTLKRVPYPSLADVGYLAALPCFYVGIALLIKRRDRPLHRRQLARRGDRRARRGGARHRPARARAGRPDEGRPGGGADEPRLSARRHPPDQLHRRRPRRQRRPGRRRVPGDHRRADRLDPGDGIYLYQEATSGYTGGWLDELWLVGALLIAGAVALSFTHRSRASASVYSSPMVFPSIFADDRRRGPHLGSLQSPARGLDLALGRDARRGDRPDGDQLPREHRPDGGAPRRRGHRLADRARQPPQADRRPRIGARARAGRQGTATSSPSTTSTASSRTTTPTATRRATACSAGWERTWPRRSSPMAAPTASAVTSSASSSDRAAGRWADPRSRAGRADRAGRGISRQRLRGRRPARGRGDGRERRPAARRPSHVRGEERSQRPPRTPDPRAAADASSTSASRS